MNLPLPFDEVDLVSAVYEASEQGLDEYEASLFVAAMAIERYLDYADFVEEERANHARSD